MPAPLFCSPKISDEETIASLNWIEAAFLESTMLVFVISIPLEFGSTKNREMPDESSIEPSVLAATINRPAVCPSITKVFSPEILKLSPSFTALVLIE